MNELDSIRNEFKRYRALAEKAFVQLDDAMLNQLAAEETNSIAMIVRHLSGNLQSRFTDFLTSDGEKPTRDRESEFETREYSREEMMQMWSAGWRVLENTLESLMPSDLDRDVAIRGVALSVHEALARSVAHVAYHTGQIVLLARLFTRPGTWKYLSIARGESQSYNANPSREKQP